MRIFCIPCTHYFDDFTFVIPSCLCDVVTKGIGDVLGMLGWGIKEGKGSAFSNEFEALGVTFDTRNATTMTPTSKIANTEQRVRGLKKDIGRILSIGRLTAAEAAKLRGRLVFSNSQVFGRVGAMAFYHLGRRADKGGQVTSLDAQLRWCLKWWSNHLASTEPRTVPLGRQVRPVYLFTDGACEPKAGGHFGISATYGAVLFDLMDNTFESYGGEANEALLRVMTEGGKMQ